MAIPLIGWVAGAALLYFMSKPKSGAGVQAPPPTGGSGGGSGERREPDIITRIQYALRILKVPGCSGNQIVVTGQNDNETGCAIVNFYLAMNRFPPDATPTGLMIAAGDLEQQVRLKTPSSTANLR